jgi:hypothetical protein
MPYLSKTSSLPHSSCLLHSPCCIHHNKDSQGSRMTSMLIFCSFLCKMMALLISRSFLSHIDGRASTALRFLHLHIPMNATSANVSAETARTTATKTQFPATTTAITKAPQIKFNKNKPTQTQHQTMSSSILHPDPVKMMANNTILTSLLLPHKYEHPAIIKRVLLPLCQGDSAMMTATHASLLLPSIKNVSAIMMATHANLLLPYVCNNPAIVMAAHANSKLQLVVNFTPILHSEGAQTPLSMLNIGCSYSKTDN